MTGCWLRPATRWNRAIAGDWLGKPATEHWHEIKFSWPHDEAIIATLMARKLTGNWDGWLRRGMPTPPCQGQPGEGPFHLPRMHLLRWKLLAAPRR